MKSDETNNKQLRRLVKVTQILGFRIMYGKTYNFRMSTYKGTSCCVFGCSNTKMLKCEANMGGNRDNDDEQTTIKKLFPQTFHK